MSHDVVISHTRFFVVSFLALLFAKLKRLPLLHIEHGSSLVQSKNFFISLTARIYDYSIGRAVVCGANHTVAISLEVGRFIKSMWGTESTVIRRGFDQAAIDNVAISNDRPRKPGVPRILYIGRLISGKGLSFLLESLKKIESKDWEFYLIGDGPERGVLKQQASYFQRDKVIFLGQKTWAEAISHLKTADIFVNPSQSEGLPTTVAEAALCSKPVIATDVGGTRELFPAENHNLLVPTGDVSILSERILMLINDKEYAIAAGTAAKQFVAKNFDWERSIQAFRNVLDELNKKK